jgi:hypothetical protein
MRQVVRIDSDGFFIEPVILKDDDLTPEDCVEEPIEESFFLPRWYDGLWVEGKSIEVILEHEKTLKIKELNTACNLTILGRFSLIRDGATYFFSNDMEAQANFEKCDRAFEKGRITAIPWTCYDGEGSVVRLDFDAESFEPLYIAHLTHIQNNIAKFRDELMPQVLAATSIEEVRTIQW